MTFLNTFARAIKSAFTAPCPTWTEYLRADNAAR